MVRARRTGACCASARRHAWAGARTPPGPEGSNGTDVLPVPWSAWPLLLPPVSNLSATGYQVIARKWRPQTFGDVVGQDHVVRTLRNAISRGRIAHAYLFVGPRGTGKTSIARIFAKALNCTGGPKADFNPKDPAVVAIAEGSHLDVIEIDGASNNGVEQIRDLRDAASYVPAQGRYKVYIVDEVHMLS